MPVFCKVCWENYVPDVKDPLFLPCGHSFCTECLNNLNKDGSLKCPFCSYVHHGIHVENLPVNFDILTVSLAASEAPAAVPFLEEAEGLKGPALPPPRESKAKQEDPCPAHPNGETRRLEGLQGRKKGLLEVKGAIDTPQENKKPRDLTPLAAPSPDLPLLNFAFTGNLSKLKKELDDGSDVNMADPNNGRTALHLACLAGHEDIVSTLLFYDANTHARDHSGKRPLHMAAEEGHSHLLPLLLAKCLMEARDNRGRRALHLAGQRGHLSFLKVLEENGAHLSAVCGIENSTALHLAAEEGHLEVVMWLVEQDVSISTRDKDRLTAEDRARARQHMQVVNYLEKASAGQDCEGVSKGDPKWKGKAKPEVFNKKPEVFNKKHEVFNKKLKVLNKKPEEFNKKPEVFNKKPEEFNKKLEVFSKKPEVLSKKPEVFSKKPEVSSKKPQLAVKYSMTPVKHQEVNGIQRLLEAAGDGDVGLVTQLMEEGVPLEECCSTEGEKGLRALHLAAWGGYEEIVEVLLRGGAKAEAEAAGRRAVHWAAAGGHVEALKALKNGGCNVHALTADGSTALHLAAEQGNLEASQWLVQEAGIRVSCVDGRGRTVLEVAKEGGFTEIVDFLEPLKEQHSESAQRMEAARSLSPQTAGKQVTVDGTGTAPDPLKLGELDGGGSPHHPLTPHPSTSLLSEAPQDSLLSSNLKTVEGVLHLHKQVDLSRLNLVQRSHVLRELRDWTDVTSAFVVDHMIEEERTMIHVFSFFCEGENLSQRIERQKETGEPFPTGLVHSWTLALTLALKDLHARDLLHANVRPQNVFFSGSGAPTLGALGTRRFMQPPEGPYTPDSDAEKYTSPEVMAGKSYSSPADMWALGCCLYELVALQNAFPYTQVTVPGHFGVEYKSLVEALLEPKPERRPSASQVLHLPLLKNALKEQLENATLLRLHKDVVRHVEALKQESAAQKDD